jgi:hypothetical protein
VEWNNGSKGRKAMNDDFDLALVPFLERNIPSFQHSVIPAGKQDVEAK